jgi:hypothetical protein
MIIPAYDEFYIYNNEENEIDLFVEKLVKSGERSDKIIVKKCILKFGIEKIKIIEKVIYGD